MPALNLAVIAEPTPTGWTITVTSPTVVRDLMLLVDRLDPDAIVDIGLTTMLPGESIRISVTGARTAEASGFSSPVILRSANQLVTR